MILKLVIFVNILTLIACAQILVNHSNEKDLTLNHRKGKKNKQKDDTKQKKEKWLVDSIFYDDYQADVPSPTRQYDLCPPVPDVIDEDACAKDTCKSDADCKDTYRCCFNGCAYSCLYEVQPAPVVDWLKEPRRSRSGISWLIPDRHPDAEEPESCTTGPFEADEDPLLCPHGYFCYVESGKNPNKKKSNIGKCVKKSDEQYPPGDTELALTAALNGRRICHVDGIVLLDGASLRLTDRKCNCKRGFLSCESHTSSYRKLDVKVERKSDRRHKGNKDRRKERKGKKGRKKQRGKQNKTG